MWWLGSLGLTFWICPHCDQNHMSSAKVLVVLGSLGTLQCPAVGKVTCHGTRSAVGPAWNNFHDASWFEGQQKSWKPRKHRVAISRTTACSDTSRDATKNKLRSEDRRWHWAKVLRCRMVWRKSGHLIGWFNGRKKLSWEKTRFAEFDNRLMIYSGKGGSDVIYSLTVYRGNF